MSNESVSEAYNILTISCTGHFCRFCNAQAHWADAQADLCICCARRSFCWNCHEKALRHFMAKPTKWLCVQQRFWSAWASASLRLAHRHFVSFDHAVSQSFRIKPTESPVCPAKTQNSEDSNQTGRTHWATAWQNQLNDYAQWRLGSAGHPPSLNSFRCPHEESFVP